jgi:glycine oxidase ThiO
VDSADVVVCGAGVIGCAIARELARAGARVTLIDRDRPAAEASGAAAGLLTSQADAVSDSSFARLCHESGALYPALALALSEETGIDVHLSPCGTLRVPADAADARAMRDLVRWQRSAGWRVESVSGKDVAALSGGALSPEISEALHFPDEAVVDNRELVRAFQTDAERHGARVLTGREVRSIRIDRGACAGVRTSGGDIAAGVVVDAAGAWADFDPALPFPIPIRPVRGQIVEVAEDSGSIPRVLMQGGFYVAPRERGRVLLGSTAEEAGFVRRVTAEGMRDLTGRAIALVPRLSRARFVTAWAGLRPAAPDGLPIIGATPVPGFLLAAGHFRNGLVLAPATAAAVADITRGRAARFDISAYSVSRFEAQRGNFDYALQRETGLGKIAQRQETQSFGNG